MSRDNSIVDRFGVIYHLTVPAGSRPESFARDIALEQTVEVPERCIPEEVRRAGIAGRVESVSPLPGRAGAFEAVITYRSDVTGFSVPQLFNVLYGNISLKKGVRIVDVRLSPSLHESFPGPCRGIEGIRDMTGVYGRPLTAGALKPMGSPTDQLAAMAGKMARAGIDCIKDDHGLGDLRFHPFAERVARCQEAVERANAATGRNTLYFPMVSGGFDRAAAQVEHALRSGVHGVLAAPLLLGPDTVRFLSREYGVAIIAHPALTGVFFRDPHHGMTPAVLLGTLFRMIGCDVSIFPNWGGRFFFSRDECVDLAGALRRPEGQWQSSFPCPAGGMALRRIEEMAAAFGPDTMLLIGGGLMERPEGLQESAAGFVDKVASLFQTTPAVAPCRGQSCCDFPPGGPRGERRDLLRFHDFQWEGRPLQAYKEDAAAPDFKGIVRQELVGRFGEHTAFDLRYFEIEPGGCSSLERHRHEHAIICVRGSGILCKGSREFSLHSLDIAYTAPMEPHRLVNRGSGPFGFFCIVDHRRDRPVGVTP